MSIQGAASKFLSKKVAGIPVPIIAAGAGAAWWWWSTSAGDGSADPASGEEPIGDVGEVPAFDGQPAFGPGNVTITKTTNIYGGRGGKRRCPEGKHWDRRKKRCVRNRAGARRMVANGRGTSRVPTSASRVVAARRR